MVGFQQNLLGREPREQLQLRQQVQRLQKLLPAAVVKPLWLKMMGMESLGQPISAVPPSKFASAALVLDKNTGKTPRIAP